MSTRIPYLWYLAGSAQLGSAAKAILQDPTSALFLPATALAEACWIVECGRVALAVTDVLTAVDNDPRITIIPLDRNVIERSNSLTAIGEMHDRQIVATALMMQDQGETVDLLTKDGNIEAVGQYVVYQDVLEEMVIERWLYLAVPDYAQEGILSEPIGELLIRKHGIRLMVYSPETEEVIAWKP